MSNGPEPRPQPRHPSRSAITRRRVRSLWRWIIWKAGPRLLALPLALYANRRFLGGPAAPVSVLPEAPWAFAEQQRLLERSEQRLQSIEGKGPGLATACAVVAAAIGVAISLTWKDACTAQQVLLLVSAAYAVMSLAAPIKLVGPIERRTITSGELFEIAHDNNPEATVARLCAQAAAENDRSTLRLGNLQAASRNDLIAATALFVAWAITALLS